MSNKFTKMKQSFSAQRRLLNGSIFEYLVVFALYFLCAWFLTGTVMANLGTQIFSSMGDATSGFLWLNFTDKSLDPFMSHLAYANYPYGETYPGVTLVSYFAYWMPMRLISFVVGPIAALNIIMYLGYLSSAMAMYLVLKRLTGKRVVAFIGGYAVAFVPYAILKSSGHMSYIFSGVFSLMIGLFLSAWRTPTSIKAGLFGAITASAFYIDGYFMLMAAVLGVSCMIAGLAWNVLFRTNKKLFIKQIKLAAISLGTFLVLISPMLFIYFTHQETISSGIASNRSDIAGEIVAYRSNVMDFLIPQRQSLLFGDDENMETIYAYKNLRSNEGESSDYVSYVLYVLSAIGLILLLVRIFSKKHSSLNEINDDKLKELGLAVLLVAIGATLTLAFMFSPEIIVFGQYIKLPGAYFIENNIALWRVLSRLFVVYNVLIVVWSMISIWLITVAMRDKIVRQRVANVVVGAILVAVGAYLALDYFTPTPRRPYDFSKQPRTYTWLKNQSDIESVVYLPLVDPLDARTSIYTAGQIIHGKKILNMKTPGKSRMNGAVGSAVDRETVDWILERKADAVLFISQTDKCELPELGRTVYSEKIAIDKYFRGSRDINTLCTVRVDSAKDALDKVYVVFSDGFSPSADSLDQSNVVFSDGGVGDIMFTEDDFSTIYDGKVRLTGKLHFATGSSGAKWQAYQNKKQVGQGEIVGDTADINLIADGNKKITIKIVTPKKEIRIGDAYIANVVADAISE